jgi:Predicted Zn-dependent peptidases, insulinase-like
MEKLALLDKEYLTGERGEAIESVKAVPRWTESQRREISAPAVEGKQNGTVLLSWLTGLNTDNRERIVANVVSDLLLGTPTSPLYAAILASPLGEDIADASGVYSDFYQMPFIVGFSGIAKANSEKAEAFFLDTLRSIVEKGFSKEEIEAVLSKAEFALREVQTKAGVRIAIKVIRGWERGLPPSSFLSSASLLEEIRAELEKDSRFFEHWIEKNLLENSHRLLLSAIPDKDYLKNEEKMISEAMETEKARYSEADEKSFNAFEESEDPAEERAKLPTLSVSDFPRDVISYDTGEKSGILTLSLPCTGRIIYDNLMFDISDFTLEELCDAYLLTKVFASSGTSRMVKAKLQSALQLAFGSITSYIEITSSLDGPKQFFVIKAKALSEKHKASLELLSSFLGEMKITASDVKDGLVDIISTLREETIYSGSYYMGLASTASINRVGYVSDALFGVGSWLWFEEAKNKPADYFLGRLEAIRSRIFSALRLSFQCAGEETDLESAASDAAALKNMLSKDKPESVPDLSLPGYSARAYIAPSSVAFNALSFASSERFTREQAAEVLLLSCLQSKALWNAIRSKGGAYGAEAHVDIIEETATFSSYRDPRVKGTWEDFLSVLKEAPVTQEDLDNAVITAVGASIKPLSPSAKATASIRNRLTGVSDELRRKKREWDLEMSLLDLEEARDRLLKYSEKASFATLVPSAVYEKEQLSMERVQLPF